MKLIDRYVTEVGKHLPLVRGREDIEKELRSTLEDMLDERAEKAGRAADEAMEVELLKEYGSPQEVAATYNAYPYLIGPHVFPFFIMILKITIFGIIVGLSVVTGIQLVTEMSTMGEEFIRIIGHGIGSIVSTSIAAFGYIVLAFAIIERFVPEFELRLDDKKEWEPASLLKEPDPDSAKRGELIVEIIFTFLALAILNLYPQVLGFGFFVNDQWFYIPIFSAAFLNFVPWINLTLLAKIGLDVYLLRTALWTPLTRMAKIIIDAATLAITVFIYCTPNIIGFTAASFANSPIDPQTAKTITTLFTTFFPLLLALVMFIQGVDLAKSIYKLFKTSYQTK